MGDVGLTVAGRATRRAAMRGALALAGGALAACGEARPEGSGAASKAPIKLSFMSWRPIAMEQFAPAWKEYGQKHSVIFEVDPSGDGA